MSAIIYSPATVRWPIVAILLGLCCRLCCPAPAADNPENEAAQRALQAYKAAAENWNRQPEKPSTLAGLAKACFDWAEFATNSATRAALATEGIETARRLITLAPDNPAGHHYLAMNLGQLARTKTLSALRIVSEMERAFLKARALDPAFDHAGPDRYLGKLYRDAPSWPASIGSRSKARLHFQRSTEVASHFPENHLCYLETLLRWGDLKAALQAANRYRENLPAARAKFAHEPWLYEWPDWDRRWNHCTQSLEAR